MDSRAKTKFWGKSMVRKTLISWSHQFSLPFECGMTSSNMSMPFFSMSLVGTYSQCHDPHLPPQNRRSLYNPKTIDLDAQPDGRYQIFGAHWRTQGDQPNDQGIQYLDIQGIQLLFGHKERSSRTCNGCQWKQEAYIARSMERIVDGGSRTQQT